MYARLLAGDADYNGRFFFGVVTTGIYCLPSCRARKPRPENVRFFPSCEAARAAGLRACRKCHPDDFARGADPVLESVEALVAEIRTDPAAFADARAVVRRSGFGPTRLFELLRQHFHATPADLLLRARLDAAKRALLAGNDSLGDVAAAAGFESLSTFHDSFRRRAGVTPTAYRELRNTQAFEIGLPEGYPLPYLRRALGRDSQSLTERLDGDDYRAAIQLADGPVLLKLQLSPRTVAVRFEPIGTQAAGAAEVHARVAGLLGLDQDAAAFSRLARKLGLARLVAGRTELRISQTPSVFDGLLWAIVGQQINFAFACLLKRRLVERAGTPVAGHALYAPPTPAAVAALTPDDLLSLQFSRQKAAYVIGTARLVAEGRLDLEAPRTMSATRAERTLLELHGLGPWSVHYLMMRSLGFPDCVPLGDTGVTSGLQALLKLEKRPDVDATRRLMAVFAPFRSLATAQLWQFKKPIPS
ncbi:MAG TPA: Ada metal-binding domain-containing protein [Opitutaceae bacterium]|nr:Ada metal-binding domain-containing protein [Opitutaceae bacterium]